MFASNAVKGCQAGSSSCRKERSLDQLFRDRTVTRDSLAAQLSKIRALKAQVRGAHLKAHLAKLRILTPEQIAQYATLRGYTGSTNEHNMTHHHN